MSELKDLQKRALLIANQYDDYSRQKGRRTWDLNDYVDSLVGNVGDLMKSVMAVRDRRDMSGAIAKAEHELNDILRSLLVLYKMFELDPDESFKKALIELEQHITTMKEGAKRV